MVTVGELKRWINAIDNDDLPVMLSSHYSGYDPLEQSILVRPVCFQGYRGESGPWQTPDKADNKHSQSGTILAVLIGD
jgi:hypothetical protein